MVWVLAENGYQWKRNFPDQKQCYRKLINVSNLCGLVRNVPSLKYLYLVFRNRSSRRQLRAGSIRRHAAARLQQHRAADLLRGGVRGPLQALVLYRVSFYFLLLIITYLMLRVL